MPRPTLTGVRFPWVGGVPAATRSRAPVEQSAVTTGLMPGQPGRWARGRRGLIAVMGVRAVVESARTELMRDPENTQRSTFLELFFDLVFAFALTRLADGLINDLGWDDALETAILLPALWWVWTLTVWMNDWLEPDRLPVQATVVAVMLGSLIMSAAVPRAF